MAEAEIRRGRRPARIAPTVRSALCSRDVRRVPVGRRSLRFSLLKNARTEDSFDGSLVDRAQAIARTYAATLKPDNSGGFVGSSVELPFVLARGRTKGECLANLEDETTHVVAMLLREGQVPPVVGGHRRVAQINVRVSPRDKTEIESAARREGFQSISDFVRQIVLQHLRRLR
jgi:predicted RNase H-like HicB family nuclease